MDQNTEKQRCETLGTYNEFIGEHLTAMKKSCEEYIGCINNLLETENPLVVLKGGNISLNRTCGLISPNENGNYTTLRGKCSLTEREQIRSYTDTVLTQTYNDDRAWKNVRTCINNNYGSLERTTVLDDICRLARQQKEICKAVGPNVHNRVEDFLNKQIQNLQCTCRKLEDKGPGDHDHVSLPMLIGVGVGVFLLLVLVIVLILVVYRCRKSRKKKRSQNVIYLPAPNSETPVYQEVFDEKGFQRYGHSVSNNPPSLPNRYNQDEPAYLEPVVAGSGYKYRPKPAIPNPGYEYPPRYSQYEKEIADGENAYFDPLPSPSAEGGYEKIAEARSSLPLDEPPVPQEIALKPVPAKRVGSDKKTESPYYVLEDGANVDTRNTV
ncbi:uncharacterized protein LOC131927841 isoform X2 [Physella acuta]|uniref:uncharacterized protein LOC131927841 isoform X2 n=1 Tax=Physella acuta TaxID=109671 RepID=UPI0027DB5D90|nr:uncharacterized protein LOC131927841 isoform X2 [Physella acuta]XP_059139686.1 uncharacterized protein LOC131927841 isoform X2 [Physella acuta]